jgi:2-phospho-L-lactate/phosphoenolpyruvate guanylyltransferase
VTEWTVLVPVRRRDGKSRLGAGVARQELTRAMVTDVVAAARSCPSVREVVVVVGGDDDVDWLRGAWRADGTGAACRTVVGGQGLNEDLASAAATCPEDPVVVVMADLAAITSEELAGVLDHASPVRGVVADAGRTGTSLLLSRRGRELAPHFGPGSFAHHLATGATDLTALAGEGARLDVDTPADLARLATGELTPGPATAAALAALPAEPRVAGAGPVLPPATSTSRTVHRMSGTSSETQQVFGTVAAFDPGSRAGRVLLDDGRALTFEADAFDVGGLLHLRSGQRVRLQRDAGGTVVSVTLSTFPAPGTDPRTTGLGRP